MVCTNEMFFVYINDGLRTVGMGYTSGDTIPHCVCPRVICEAVTWDCQGSLGKAAGEMLNTIEDGG